MKIDWAYLRKGWKSCQNAQEFLGKRKIQIVEEVDARKRRIDSEEAWKILSTAKKIVTAKGKKVQTWNPQSDDKDSILKHAMGPSGNLRAPAYRWNNNLTIGFNVELYEAWLG